MAVCPKCRRTYSETHTLCPDDGELLIPDKMMEGIGDRELRRGETVGEYVIEGKLGAGTFGDVYRAVQPLIGKQVAIKILSQKYSTDPMIVSRFIAEARAVNQIRHRNIIDIFSFGQLPDGRHYHIMELLNGKPLDEVLKDKGRIPLVEVVLILRPIARALDAAHASGIAHRDLKPANIFLARDDDGNPFPKLLDFGIAKLMTDAVPRQHQTATGMAVGTPDYMSPEQCQGTDVDHRTDVYAFGVMAYQLMTGILPFKGANVVEVLIKQISAQPTPPSSVQPDLPTSVDAPILWMMEKEKENRPPDLATAINALEVAVNASGVSLPRASQTGDPSATPVMVPRVPAAVAMATSSVTAPPASKGGPLTLSDPALSETLPTEAKAISMKQAGTGSKRGLMFTIGGIGVVAAAGFALAAFFSNRDPVITPDLNTEVIVKPMVPTKPDPATTPADETPPPKKMEAVKEKITLRIETTPGGAKAQIFGSGDVSFGSSPATIELVKQDKPVHFEVRAQGYAPQTVDFVPSQDDVISIALKKQAPKKKKTKKKDKDEIESFD